MRRDHLFIRCHLQISAVFDLLMGYLNGKRRSYYPLYGLKRCSGECGEVKPVSEFHERRHLAKRGMSGRYMPRCKTCWNKSMREYRVENHERVKEIKARSRLANLGTYRASAARRRAVVSEAVVEVFDPSEIYARDGWRCQICGGRVSRAKSYPDPRSASLDHIVPLHLGGLHSRDNVQCSHLACNHSKGGRSSAGQHRMVFGE